MSALVSAASSVLAQPTLQQLELHARVPPELHGGGGRSAWAAREHGVDELPSFLEGPVVDKNGDLYVVDVAWGRILKVDVAARFSLVTAYEGEPNGLAVAPDGRLFVADHRHGLLVLDRLDGSVEPRTVVGSHDGVPFLGLNDLAFGMSGDLYFTDQGASGLHDPRGRVFRLDSHGQLHLLLDGVPSPNGIAVNADESALFVAVTRDNAVWRVPLMADGNVTKVGRYLQLSGGVGPDGLHLHDDRLLVAHLGLGVVWVFGPSGLPIKCLQTDTGMATTNVTVVPDSGRVYVTESQSGSVLTTSLGAPDHGQELVATVARSGSADGRRQ